MSPLILAETSIPAEPYALIGTILTAAAGVIAAWLKNRSAMLKVQEEIRDELRKTSTEIRNHTDSSVAKLNGMLRYMINSMDRPCWLKLACQEHGKTVFRMLELNDLYTDSFGFTRNEAIGKTDLEAGVDHDTAQRFYDHDLMVWASGEPQTFDEEINGVVRRFHKMRVQTDDGVTKGILGFAADTTPCPDCPHCKSCNE